MRELVINEIQEVTGGAAPHRGTDWIDGAESEWGKTVNDFSNWSHNVGSHIGGSVYDWIHED